MMDAGFVKTAEVQDLLDRAVGAQSDGGDARVKAVLRDLLEGLMTLIVRHDLTEDEVWAAVQFLQRGAGELGLIMPGVGLEHFLDLHRDAKDAAADRLGGTPRTIEGPLYVANAPLTDSGCDLTTDADGSQTLHMRGRVTGPDGEAVPNAILHVWHANSKGFYSHFDPTGEQSAFNNRRRIRARSDGSYAFHSKMPNGYSIPPNGVTDALMRALGRHGNRPAHVHFFVEAPGYRHLTTQINFGDDPFAADDFAFGTRDGLLPVPDRQADGAHVAFDFVLQRATTPDEQRMSSRERLVVA